MLDLSNAWWDRYVRKPERSFLLGPKNFHQEGIVLVTDKKYQNPGANKQSSQNWSYFGFYRHQLLRVWKNFYYPLVLEDLFLKRASLVSFFSGHENQLIDLDSWFSEKEISLYLDQAAEKPKELQKPRFIPESTLFGCWR